MATFIYEPTYQYGTHTFNGGHHNDPRRHRHAISIEVLA